MTSAIPPVRAFDRSLDGPASTVRVLTSRRESAWARPAFAGVMALAAVLYLANLTVSGYANTYYAAAAWAASQSWSAWFFGSIDPAGFITLDKPPLATMVIGLSVRLFGLTSASILVPEALMGVATVGLVYVLVRRTFGPAAATIAGLVTALTPAAVLIFRYDNPDALLTLLLVAAAGSFLRGLETDRLRWLALAGVLVGLGFLTKYLQAYLVLPAFAITYAIAGRGRLRRRVAGLAVAAVATVVASGWWILVVELVPAALRPYIGGSATNSALDLVLGYDGLGRIFGRGGAGGPAGAAGPGGSGGPAGGGFAGVPGLLRMFNAQFAGQVAWLLPLSAVGLGSGLLLRLRGPRTDLRRAAYLMWGLWLVVHVLVFSLMSGIIHSYYVVVLAPAIGALVGAGVVDLWRHRAGSLVAGGVLGAAIAVSGAVAWILLDRTPSFVPGVGPAVFAIAVVAGALVALPPAGAWVRRLALVGAAGAGVALLAGPTAYATSTIALAHAGGDPAAGPVVEDAVGGFGPVGDPTSDTALVDYLLANRGDTTWVVATWSADRAGSLELAAHAPVMAMGGFSGTDPVPTVDQLRHLVAAGKLRYVLLGGAGAGGAQGGPGGLRGPTGPGDGNESEIAAWVESVGTVVDVGATGAATLYDLSNAAST
jgi:4-amino-4-deoxy-L-arabinose transferase-like glycosyltransferase